MKVTKVIFKKLITSFRVIALEIMSENMRWPLKNDWLINGKNKLKIKFLHLGTFPI